MPYDKVVAYDLETTGLSRTNDKILEIGAVAYYPKTGEQRRFSTLVGNHKLLGWQTTLITGLSHEVFNQEGFLKLDEAVKAFSDFILDGSPRKILFVGHNIVRFDHKFINPHLKRLRRPVLDEKNSWCTLDHFRKEIALKRSKMTPRKAKRYKPKANLTAACEYYRISAKLPAHRALPDAENSFRVFLKQKQKERARILSRPC